MIPDIVLWLLPALFVVHDAEEAIWLIPWLQRNRQRLKARFPALAPRLFAHFERLSRPAFVAMAAEEFILLLGVTLYAQFSGNYLPWLALFLAFGLHLLIHLVQAVAVRGYVPSLATSLLGLPLVGWMLAETINSRLFPTREFMICALVGVAAAAVNLFVIHAVAGRMTRR